ncbi:MAG: sugar phosphate nucleotidyltransferase [archaeon]
MRAIILAGGFGTRLKSVSGDVPKPMVSIAGKPFLEHQIRFLKDQGITEVILAVHNKANQIKSYFRDGSNFNVNITYSEEETPLGTAGAIKNAERYVDNTFLVLNGDSYSQLDLKKLVDFHKSKRSNFTLALTTSSDPSHYGNVILNENRIMGFSEKKVVSNSLINSGVYVFEPKIFDYIEPGKKTSIEGEVFPQLANEGTLWGFPFEGYFRDIGRPESLEQFKKDVLEMLILREDRLVRDALYKLDRTGINLVLIAGEQKKLLGVVTEGILKRFLLHGGNPSDPVHKAMTQNPITGKTTDSEASIYHLLESGVNSLPILDEQGKIVSIEFKSEVLPEKPFPTLRGRAPLRISFAGGGTDLPSFFNNHGGVVINATIDKYCHASITKRADSKIHINSDLGREVLLDSWKSIEYDGKFDLVKAVIKIMKPPFGFDLYLRNDIPPGRGLGSSASLAVLVISLLSTLQELNYDDYKIAEIAYNAEREELGIKGGWQDQYAAVTGGFSLMEFEESRTLIHPLRLKEDIVHELVSHLMLCYVGQSHFSGDLHQHQEKFFQENEEIITKIQNEHKIIAVKIKDSLLKNEIGSIGRLLHESWINKRRLSKSITNPKIDDLYRIGLENGAYGGRLLGSGGGGYLLFFSKPTKRNELTKALQESGGEVLNFNFEFGGTRVWKPKMTS